MKPIDEGHFALQENKLFQLLRVEGYEIELSSSVSEDLFDLRIMGGYKLDNNTRQIFTGWLPLLAIRAFVDYSSEEVSEMTDYPEMAREVDWSSVRDSTKEKQWNIFYTFVLPLLER